MTCRARLRGGRRGGGRRARAGRAARRIRPGVRGRRHIARARAARDRGARALGRGSSRSPVRSGRRARRRCCDGPRACGATHASAASYNNHWGVPLTLARMPADADFGIFEIGMNHAGEIAPLTRMARPHAALITTIAPVHIEYLGSLEAIADAKAEIFLGLEPGGAAVLNRDAPEFGRLARARGGERGARRTFGAGAECDARLLEVDGDGRRFARACAVLGRDMRFDLGAPGVTWRRTRSARCSRRKRSAPTLRRAPRRWPAFRRRRAGASASDRRGRRLGDHHRRKLQRQSGLDARGAGAARRGEARAERAAHRRHRRHARTRRRRRGDARRARRRARAPTTSIFCSGRGRSPGRCSTPRRRRCAPHGPSGRAS